LPGVTEARPIWPETGAQVEFGGFDFFFGDAGLGFGFALEVFAVVEDFFRDDLAFDEGAGAFNIEACVADTGFGLFEFGFGLGEDAFVGAGVDDEEEVAFFDLLAILKHDILQIAVNAGAQIDGFGGVEAGRGFIPFNDLACDGLADDDGLHGARRRRGRWRCGGACRWSAQGVFAHVLAAVGHVGNDFIPAPAR
jgi:hypothetical protein